MTKDLCWPRSGLVIWPSGQMGIFASVCSRPDQLEIRPDLGQIRRVIWPKIDYSVFPGRKTDIYNLIRYIGQIGQISATSRAYTRVDKIAIGPRTRTAPLIGRNLAYLA